MHFRKLFATLSFLFIALLSANAMAAHVSVLVGVAPEPREVIVPPPGYMSCYSVPAGYFGGRWVVQHNQCQYSNAPGVWVAGHWECNKFNPERGTCRHWRWIASYWSAPEMGGPVMMGPPPVVASGTAVIVEQPGPEVVVGFGPGHYYHRHGWR